MAGNQAREQWGSKLGFILAATGSAVGLGNLWKFPYITGENGGGIFVLIYLVCIALVGIPVFLAEVLIGRATQSSPVVAFDKLSNSSSTNWNFVGWIGVFSGFIILSYYSVVAGWALNYTLMSISHFFETLSPDKISQTFDVLYTSGDINVFWHAVFMLLTVGVVYGGIKGGIEKWSRILMPLLLGILVVLFFYAMTLDGFGRSFKFLFYPDVSKLKPSGVLEALGHAFFTLSLGMGAIITYGSYLSKKEDLVKTSVIIAVLDTAVAIIATLVLFPIIFTFGYEPQAGPGLLFKTLPIIFSQIPGGMILSIIFFLLVVFAALTSGMSLLEVVSANFIDLLGWGRKKAVLIMGSIIFIIGIPSALSGSGAIFKNWEVIYGINFFDTVDYLASNWLLPIGGLLIAVFTGWFMDKRIRESEYMTGTSFGKGYKYWLFLIRYIAPIAVFIIVLQRVGFINIDKILTW